MLRRITHQYFTLRRGDSCLLYKASNFRNYYVGCFINPKRRPQLTEEERKKVTIDQEKWPEEFKDYDPEDPYKYSPDWIEGLSPISFLLAGIELCFIFVFFELCFPYGI